MRQLSVADAGRRRYSASLPNRPLCGWGPAATSGAADSEAAAVAVPTVRTSVCGGGATKATVPVRASVPLAVRACACARHDAPVRARARASHGATVLLLAAEQAYRPGTRKLPHSTLIASSCTLTSSFQCGLPPGPRGPGPGPPAHFKTLEHSEELHLAGVRDNNAVRDQSAAL
jgi:hypothetical protein